VGALLFFLKPILYLVAFIVGAKLFAKWGPHSKWPVWLVIPIAALGRWLMGVFNLIVAFALAGSNTQFNPLSATTLFVIGYMLWLGVAGPTFRRAPFRWVALFAVLCDVMSTGIDIWAWLTPSHFHYP
jgi:hypothetical protein